MNLLPQVVSQTQIEHHKICLELIIQPELIYFEGHFPNHPVLPGVAQLNWAVHFAAQMWSLDKSLLRKINQIKFSRIIVPNTKVMMQLELIEQTIKFRYFDDDRIFSSGSIAMEDKA
jgi:3-hydroxyacyl-[acyl-carrier-protein] dehydratase